MFSTIFGEMPFFSKPGITIQVPLPSCSILSMFLPEVQGTHVLVGMLQNDRSFFSSHLESLAKCV